MKLAKLTLILFVFLVHSVQAQLDVIHWIPPMTASAINNIGAEEHSIYLTTPETTPFNVTVTTGTGTPFGTYVLSNAAPVRIDLPNGFNVICMEPDSVGLVQRDDGLILTGPSAFYVNYRVRSGSQAGSLTTKGVLARGTEFYWTGAPNLGGGTAANSVLGIMAMNDNTTITIDDYNTNCAFRQGSNATAITSNSISITLDAGETYVLEIVYTGSNATRYGWYGAHVVSSDDIVVNNGQLMSGIIPFNGSRDICIDQTLPVDRLGDEFITIRGNGTDATENVVVTAVTNGTTVDINGGAASVVLNEGDFHIFDGTNYGPNGNMYITSTAPIYVNQIIAGSVNTRTIGLNFIPALSCLMPLEVDNVADIELIRTTAYTGGANILTRSGATVTINGTPIGATPQSLLGTTDWVTYQVTGLTGNVRVASNQPMAMSMFGANVDAGYGGYYSGFSGTPIPTASANANCLSANLNLNLNVGSLQWFFNGTSIPGETNSSTIANTAGDYFATVSFGSCIDSSNVLTIPNVNCGLPVEFGQFTGQTTETGVDLRWNTLSELNSSHFILERSNGGAFEEIAQLNAQGTTQFETHYNYLDQRPIPGTNYYRLTGIDIDGSVSHTETIAIDWLVNEASVYPNPATNEIIVQLVDDQVKTVRLFTSDGRMVKSQKTHDSQLKWNIENLPEGVYIINIEKTDGWQQLRFVKRS